MTNMCAAVITGEGASALHCQHRPHLYHHHHHSHGHYGCHHHRMHTVRVMHELERNWKFCGSSVCRVAMLSSSLEITRGNLSTKKPNNPDKARSRILNTNCVKRSERRNILKVTKFQRRFITMQMKS